jgi:hypothetical protein
MTKAGILCAIAASIHYHVPADGLLAVYQIENGASGQWVRNANGTYDVGPMQFNTSYLATLRQYGIQAKNVESTGRCYPFELAAWRIHEHIQGTRGDLWTRIAHYHSTSPGEVSRYRARLIVYARRWRKWLEENFQVSVLGGREGR